MQRNQEDMFALIEQWKNSAESRKAFCRRHNIAPSTFSYWYAKYQKTESAVKPGFVEVQPHLSRSLELIYPNGVKIRLPHDTSLSELRTLLQLNV
ncbi:IS66 family insertion sequence element accessory protein TnpA [Marinoscillum furvescens]|nr:hypothetical protein [Marinoscillum furvescens]